MADTKSNQLASISVYLNTPIIAVLLGIGFIVGSGEAEDYYKEHVKASFLENKIYFIGEVPYIDLLQITASADAGLALISSNSISYKYALPN